jgi:hypothetical protein
MRFCVFVLICGVCAQASAQVPTKAQCTQAEAMQALDESDRLRDWDELYRSFQRFAQCDDGAIAEGYDDTIEKLLVGQWDRIDQFVTLGKSNEPFRIFVLKHINALITAEGAETITRNARSSCPRGDQELCRIIIDRLIAARDPRGGVESLPGPSSSRGGRCEVELRTNPLGGANDLFLVTQGTKSSLIQEDVNGMAWISDSVLAFTVSPIYGQSGVYVFDCKTRKLKRIVRPRTTNRAYPTGADYFELYWVSDQNPAVLFFYYALDVDRVDFASFRTEDHLFKVTSNGTEFRKTVDTDKLPAR